MDFLARISSNQCYVLLEINTYECILGSYFETIPFFTKHFYLCTMYTFVSVHTHNFLAFRMSCNPLLSSLFWMLSFFPWFGQWDSPSASLLCLLTCLYPSLSTFLLAHITWRFRFFLHFPWSNHRIRYFSTSNGSFLWKWYLRAKTWVLGVLLLQAVPGAELRIPGPLSGWSWRICMCVLTHTLASTVFLFTFKSVSSIPKLQS